MPIGEPAIDALKAWRRVTPKAWELDGPVITNLRGGRLTTRAGREILARSIDRGRVSERRSHLTACGILRNAYAQLGRRLTFDSGDARACEPRDHPALYSCEHQPSQERSTAGPIRAPEFYGVIRGTTIICVRNAGHVVVAGDGQVSDGQCTIMKMTARRCVGCTTTRYFGLRRRDCGQRRHCSRNSRASCRSTMAMLRRAAVELAKDWRTDRMLRRLEALLSWPTARASLLISGTGELSSPTTESLRSGRAATTRSRLRARWFATRRR